MNSVVLPVLNNSTNPTPIRRGPTIDDDVPNLQ